MRNSVYLLRFHGQTAEPMEMKFGIEIVKNPGQTPATFFSKTTLKGLKYEIENYIHRRRCLGASVVIKDICN